MSVELTVKITAEDAERLLKAFQDGKLTELGVLDVKIPELEATSSSQKQWANSEDERRESPGGNDLSQRP